jgi:peptidoglycan/LPS O-acetylase OafA/YrhL
MSFFFVLSGFVMTHTHLDDDMSTWQSKHDFWWKRFSKMYPIFVLFWAVSLVFYTTRPEFQIKDTLCHYVQLTMASTWNFSARSRSRMQPTSSTLRNAMYGLVSQTTVSTTD